MWKGILNLGVQILLKWNDRGDGFIPLKHERKDIMHSRTNTLKRVVVVVLVVVI